MSSELHAHVSRSVRILLKHGAEPRAHSVTFYSPLYIALYAGHLSIVQMLLKNHPELVQIATFEGWLPLHAAAKTNNVAAVKQLLHFSYPPYCADTYTDPSGKVTYRFAFDVNKMDEEMRTPLFLAAQEGHADVVKILLNFRVDVSALNHSNTKSAAEPSADITEDVLVKDKERSVNTIGDSPLKKARTKLNMNRVNVMTDTMTQSVIGADSAVNMVRPVCVDTYSRRGRTPLQVACAAGNTAIVRLLVEKGHADVNLPIAITDEDIADMGPVVDGLHCAGSGALIEACQARHSQLVDLLLECGANDHDNRALHAAMLSGDRDLMAKLLCRQVFADPEYRVNKKAVDGGSQMALIVTSGTGRQVQPSSLLPSVAVMLNWHKAGLTHVDVDWLLSASVHLNAKLKAIVQPSPTVELRRIGWLKCNLMTPKLQRSRPSRVSM